jgi:hypothetical protein
MNKSFKLFLILAVTVLADYFIIKEIIDNNNRVKEKNDLLTKGDCIIIDTEIKQNNNCHKNKYNGRVHVIAPNDLTDSDKVVRCDQYTNVDLILQKEYPIGSKYTCYYNGDTLRFEKYIYNNVVILPLFFMNIILICCIIPLANLIIAEKKQSYNEIVTNNSRQQLQVSSFDPENQELAEISID